MDQMLQVNESPVRWSSKTLYTGRVRVYDDGDTEVVNKADILSQLYSFIAMNVWEVEITSKLDPHTIQLTGLRDHFSAAAYLQ